MKTDLMLIFLAVINISNCHQDNSATTSTQESLPQGSILQDSPPGHHNSKKIIEQYHSIDTLNFLIAEEQNLLLQEVINDCSKQIQPGSEGMLTLSFNKPKRQNLQRDSCHYIFFKEPINLDFGKKDFLLKIDHTKGINNKGYFPNRIHVYIVSCCENGNLLHLTFYTNKRWGGSTDVYKYTYDRQQKVFLSKKLTTSFDL